MLHSPIQAGPGSVELPRSLAPIVKANSLLYVHFERPDLREGREISHRLWAARRFAQRG